MLRVVAPMMILFAMVTGVIYTGVATPTEASALGAIGAFAIALWLRQGRPGHAAAGRCCAPRMAAA